MGQVAIKVSALKKRYSWREATVCKVEFTNIGSARIKDFDTIVRASEPYTFFVRNARGDLMPDKPHHAEYLRAFEHPSWSGSAPLNENWDDLQPGEARTELVTLSNHVAISGRSASEPASFSVQVERFGALSDVTRISIGPERRKPS